MLAVVFFAHLLCCFLCVCLCLCVCVCVCVCVCGVLYLYLFIVALASFSGEMLFGEDEDELRLERYIMGLSGYRTCCYCFVCRFRFVSFRFRFRLVSFSFRLLS